MENYDIYWSDFGYEDNPNLSKIRPVLILSDRSGIPLGAKITKHEPRDITKGTDYLLKDYEEAGLKLPSTVRLSQRRKIYPIKKIGHISKRDEDEIKKILKGEK